MAGVSRRFWRPTFTPTISRAHAQLAQMSGAILSLPEQRRVSFPFTPIGDGETRTIGQATLTALQTPGHTPESTCYLLDQQALLTGDTLFPTGVGRPDLATTTEGGGAKASGDTVSQSPHAAHTATGDTGVARAYERASRVRP